MEDESALTHLRWVMERQLHWISAADVKAGGMIGAYMALAAIAATLLDSANPPVQAKWLFGIAAAAMLPALCFAVAVFFPRDEAKRSSLLFFGEISGVDLDKFKERCKATTIDQVKDDLMNQIYINAVIARCKHKYAKISIVWGLVALAVWLGGVATFARAS
ncbi:Pycsar system effector family protein [Stenotrophomonas sp. 22385]|uniref:Pycsar system effector family protein n=1 Tax=Stenotrophomonas sp. 22385 TaxID=3453915 RepID=UPI003F82EFC3